MSLPPINPFAGMGAVNGEERRAAQQEREQDRLHTRNTDRAAGDAESAATSETADRDADGRQLWQDQQTPAGEETEESTDTPPAPPVSRDPSGVRGTQLDLDG